MKAAMFAGFPAMVALAHYLLRTIAQIDSVRTGRLHVDCGQYSSFGCFLSHASSA
jgi:hypothetical protein